jgi:hypothetical protein
LNADNRCKFDTEMKPREGTALVKANPDAPKRALVGELLARVKEKGIDFAWPERMMT